VLLGLRLKIVFFAARHVKQAKKGLFDPASKLNFGSDFAINQLRAGF
jgi:hypothetical protein